MPDWTKSMIQTFEYYTVDPATWKDDEQLTTVKSCTISRDSEVETLGSATFDIGENVGECYIRVYLVTIQNGVRERHPLGTFLVQTPSTSHDGKTESVSVDAYTSLLELKENPPPLGYSNLKGDNIMDAVYDIVCDNLRAPVVKPSCDKKLSDNFVSNTDDTWLTYSTDLMANAEYAFDLDEYGTVLFAPVQRTAALRPVYEFNTDNSSILKPEFTTKHDMYGIPNVVEVIYSNDELYYEVVVTNDDPNSPLSTVSRGRKITHRITNPSMSGIPTKAMIEEYAKQVLEELSSVEFEITYSHGYCPVRVGDCVTINHTDAGLSNIKAKVIRQSIKCEPGCPVSETAIYTKNL